MDKDEMAPIGGERRLIPPPLGRGLMIDFEVI